MKTILGTGQLGRTILQMLLHDNPDEAIILVNRTGKLDITVPANVQVIAADVTNKEQLKSIAYKSSVMFSCTDVPYQTWGAFYPAAASALVYALQESAARLVFADNLYSYGNVAGAVMHEAMPHSARTRKGKIRAGVIQTLLQSDPAISQRVAFVKAADFIGPRIHKGLFGTDFLDRLYHGKSLMLSGKINLPHTFTYIKDFATAMIKVGNAPDAFGQIWHVPNAPALHLQQWIRLFETETGKKVNVVVLPKFMVWIAGRFDSLLKELYELAYQFEYPYLIDHQKYLHHFGDHSTNPGTIVKETVQWYESKAQ